MKDTFDRKINKMIENSNVEVPELPEDYDDYIENILSGLPDRKRRRPTFRRAIILVAVLVTALSFTVTAAVNYARQRAEAMKEEEKLDYYAQAQSAAPADFYSRELTGGEKKRMESLADAYKNEGLFPEGELKRISDSAEYDGKGVAFLASRSTWFLPQEEMSDEEILQIIDYMAKREYSLEEAARQRELGNAAAYDNVEGPEEPALDLKTEDCVLEVEGEIRAVFFSGTKDALYLSEMRSKFNGNKTCLYRLETSGGMPVKMDVEAPEGLNFTQSATDMDGNLCVLLGAYGETREEKPKPQLWRIAPDGEVKDRLKLPETVGETDIYEQMIAIDSSGRYYLKSIVSAVETVLVLDSDGEPLSSIPCGSDDLWALGRGRDGKVYGILMAGEDWIPTVVAFDVEKGKIDKKYEGVLPADLGAYNRIGAGTDSDLLIWGPSGIYSYNLGDEKAVQRLGPWELPDAGAVCILPDGRTVFEKSRIITEGDDFESMDIGVGSLYLIGPGGT